MYNRPLGIRMIFGAAKVYVSDHEFTINFFGEIVVKAIWI